MAKKVAVLNTGEVKWPPYCANCRTEKGLEVAGATAGRITSIRPTLTGSIDFTSELLNLNYPVCATHAKGLSLANLLTRNTLGPSLLRGFAYLIGAPALILLPSLLLIHIINFIKGVTPKTEGIPMSFIVIYCIAAFFFIKILFAYKKIPVRINKITEDTIWIKFKNNIYATQFMRLNKDILVEK